MKHAALCLLLLGTTVAVPACGADNEQGPDPTETPVAESGFPCEIHAVLQTYCAGCHLHQTYAPSFSTREHLRAPYKTSTFGEVAAAAVHDLKMPPYGTPARPNGAEVDLLVGWVAAGMPAGSCGPLTVPMP